MYKDDKLCRCYNTSREDIINLKAEGYRNVFKIINKTKAGKACGNCKPKVYFNILRLLLKNHKHIK